jgi:regulator of protease activity HflC (stomatin/prohibitin superfamily)
MRDIPPPLTAQTGARPELTGSMAQSVRIAFRALYAAILLLAIGWATSNIRQVPADSRAVVLRFGRVDRVQDAGLLLAWPSPIEQITLLPGRDQLTEFKIEKTPNDGPSSETDFQIHQPDDVVQLRSQKDAWNGSYFLTGDGSVVQFDATLFYKITNPTAYFLERDHIAPALQRIYLASTIAISASRDLDDFLVARPEEDSDPASGNAVAQDATNQRQALRGNMVRSINARLQALRKTGADLGIEVSRIDVVAVLPPLAKAAFDEVLTAAQVADQSAAAARTDAAQILQEADRAHDLVVSQATASADELVQTARADTAVITALASHITPATRNSVMADYYREQIAAIMPKIGTVTAIDPHDGQHLILPGPQP